MLRIPAIASRLISSALMGGGIGLGSFWRPSRGPTSTIFTKLGLVELVDKDLRDVLRVERRIRVHEEVTDG
jgi:hypothetical protein